MAAATEAAAAIRSGAGKEERARATWGEGPTLRPVRGTAALQPTARGARAGWKRAV